MSAQTLDDLYSKYRDAAPEQKELAKEALVRALYRDVWPMMNYVMGSVHPDIAAEAVTTATLHLDSFRGEARFSSWFMRIVMNYCTKAHQTKARLKEVSLDNLIETGEEPVAEMDNTFDVEKRLGQLDPEDRQLVTLRLEGRSHAEIAKALGINKDAAKHRWHRLIKRFAKESAEQDTGSSSSVGSVEGPDSAPSAAERSTRNTASNKNVR